MSKFLTHTKLETPLGEMEILASDKGICLLEFDIRADMDDLISSWEKAMDLTHQIGENRHTLELKRQLLEYFNRKRKVFSVPLVFNGTEFQQLVWAELKKIPFGTTITYKELAQRLGDEKTIRAAARANGQNHLMIVIPCHRVVGTDGKLTGYAGGIERKRYLLNLERDQSGHIDLFTQS